MTKKDWLFNELSLLDDKGIEIFERCCISPVLFDDIDELDIVLFLNEQQITDRGPLGELCIKEEYARLYNDEIKGIEFENYRKKASWVWKCLKWCENMYDIFSKELFLKLINQKEDVCMDETEMMDIFQNIPEETICSTDYNDYIIPLNRTLDFSTSVDETIEMQRKASFYVPTVEEIEEYAYRTFLFSKPAVQDMYNFLIEIIGDNKEAYATTYNIWLGFALGYGTNEVMQVNILDTFSLNQEQMKKARMLFEAYNLNQNKREFNGLSLKDVLP